MSQSKEQLRKMRQKYHLGEYSPNCKKNKKCKKKRSNGSKKRAPRRVHKKRNKVNNRIKRSVNAWSW